MQPDLRMASNTSLPALWWCFEVYHGYSVYLYENKDAYCTWYAGAHQQRIKVYTVAQRVSLLFFSSSTCISCPFGMRPSTISAHPIYPSKCPCTELISAYAFLLSLNFFVPSVRNDQARTPPDASTPDKWARLVRQNSVSHSLHSFVKKILTLPKTPSPNGLLVSLWVSAGWPKTLWTPPCPSLIQPLVLIFYLPWLFLKVTD